MTEVTVVKRKICPEHEPARSFSKEPALSLSKGRRIIAGLFLLGALLFFVQSVRVSYASSDSTAPSTVGYEISWYTVDGGGAMNLTGGGIYTLSGTAGQPDAGTQSQSSYTLGGGFWSIADIIRNFLPFIAK